MFFSALSMSSLKLFLFFIFNLRDVSAFAPKAKARTGTRICPTRQLDCIHISFATFDMPNFFPSHRLDFKRLIGHINGQVIKSCIRWDFNPCRTSDCITNTISICKKCWWHWNFNRFHIHPIVTIIPIRKPRATIITNSPIINLRKWRNEQKRKPAPPNRQHLRRLRGYGQFWLTFCSPYIDNISQFSP